MSKKTPEQQYAAFLKMRRIAAWIGIIVLVGLYLSTLILALIGTETSRTLLKFSILSTLILPVLMYGYLLLYKVLKGKGVPSVPEEDEKEHDAS